MPGDSDILESWKEIAAYLKRDVTTVQRWEKREALPVHRHQHDKSGSVFALKSELDRWRWQRTHPQGSDVEAEPPAAAEPAAPGAPFTPATPPRPLPVAPSRQMTAGRAALFAVGLVALLLTTGALVTEPRPEPPPRITFNLTLDDELSLVPSEAPSISPDGASIVFVGVGADGVTRLHLRPIGELGARPLPGARITYQVVVTAGGTGNANAAAFSDLVPANTTYVAGSLRLNGAALSDGADADAGTFVSAPAPEVRVTLGDLTGGSGPQTIEFAVTIN